MDNANQLPIERLLTLIKSEKNDLFILFYLTLGYSLLGIATPLAVQALVNNITMGGVMQPLVVISIILFCLLVLSGFLYVLELYLVEFIQRRLFVDTAVNVAHKTQGTMISVYDKTNPVELVNRFFDIITVQKSAASLLTTGLIAIIQVVIGSIILIFYSFYFSVIVLMVFLFFWLTINLLGQNATKTAIAESKAKYAVAAWIETIAANFYLFKFYNGSERANYYTNALAHQYLNKRDSHFTYLIRQNFTAVMFYALIGTAMLGIGGVLVINSQINLGQFVAAELIFFGVLAAFVRLVSKLGDYYDILAAVDKLGVLDDLPQEEIHPTQTVFDTLDRLSVSHLSFAYSKRVHPIHNINFSISKGHHIAIMGLSGTGKSTIVDLITGLRKPDKGQIEYNGVDLRQINRLALRNKIGIASDIEVFAGSILDNIRLDNALITMHEINQVLDDLGLLDDIAQLENGLDTQLTGIGAPLSSTQLQRLMLVRAIVIRPQLLIIDGIIDNLNHAQIQNVVHYLINRKADWMLLVTTRSEHIANQFDQQILIQD
ncbi:MAG: ATP-binding cassette domain-containing protein [Methylophilaceae bacterium]|nr:ATP-binding cassette domain-containing protein [Methylophilaceae bacterium]